MQRLLRLLPFIVLLGGCAATTTVDEYRVNTAPIALGSNEKLVILGRRDAGHYETDREFVSCVADKLHSDDIGVVPEQQFVDAIYPWFEPRTAPKGLARLRRLMQEPLVQAKVDQYQIRYLVWLDGTTESKDGAGSISCGIAPGAAGCLGFAKWEKSSIYEAVVWDMHDLSEKGRIRIDSQGTSYLIGAGVPIPLLTPVESDACNGLGDQLKSYFNEAG